MYFRVWCSVAVLQHGWYVDSARVEEFFVLMPFQKALGARAVARALRAPGCEAPSCKARHFTALQVLGVFQVPTHRA